MSMKQKVTLLVMAAVLGMSITLTGCRSTPKKGGTTVQITADDFRSDPNGKLTINNLSGVELAIFVGRVERGNFIGAIGTGANGRNRTRAFDIDKLTTLPQRGTFIIRATSFSVLNRKGLAGITEEDVIYSGLIVFDKNNPEAVEHDIYRGIDAEQKTFIHVSNYSRYVLELRLGSPDGEKVAVLAPNQRYKRVWVKPSDSGFPLLFYPQYVYLDSGTGELNVFSDTVNYRGQRFEPETLGIEQREISFRGPALEGPKYNVAFVNFQNDTNSLLNFMTAQGNFRRNDRGTLSTSPGRTDIYQIDSGEDGRIYTVAGVETDDGFHPIGELSVKPGHKYDLIITTMNGKVQSALADRGAKTVPENVRIEIFGE